MKGKECKMIRRAQEQDISRVLELLGQVNLVHHIIRPDLFNIGTKYTRGELSELFRDDSRPVFVLEEDGVIEGYIFTWFIDHSGDNIQTPVKELYIDDLCVDEKFRGQHVAARLFEYVKEYAAQAGCHNVTLHVWEGNDGAMAFYKAMGMKTQKTKLECVLGG